MSKDLELSTLNRAFNNGYQGVNKDKDVVLQVSPHLSSKNPYIRRLSVDLSMIPHPINEDNKGEEKVTEKSEEK